MEALFRPLQPSRSNPVEHTEERHAPILANFQRYKHARTQVRMKGVVKKKCNIFFENLAAMQWRTYTVYF